MNSAHGVLYKNRSTTLALSWAFSLIAGVFWANKVTNFSADYAVVTISCDVFFLPLLFSMLISLMLSIVCIHAQVFLPLCFVIGIEGVSLGYCFSVCRFAFGSAGWLMALFLCFPHSISQVLLFMICFRYTLLDKKFSLSVISCFCVVLIVTIALYITAVVPIFTDLLELLH